MRQMVQPNEDKILASNRELQKDPTALRKLDSMQWLASIPENVYWFLKKEFPELGSPNAQVRTKAWLQLLNSREYEKLRVRARNMARNHV